MPLLRADGVYVKVIVTGGTGFLGKKIVARLLQNKHRVTIITRAKVLSNYVSNSSNLLVVTWNNLSSISSDPQYDAIIHLAGEPVFPGRWTEKKKEMLFSSRLQTLCKTLAALDHCGANPRVVVSASAIGVYGNSGGTIVSEESNSGVGFLADLVCKWENCALNESKEFFPEIRSSVLRFGVILDGDGGVLKQLLPLFRMGLGGKLGSGEQFMSWVHAHDAVESVIYALENSDVAGIYNVVAPEPVCNREFTQALGAALHRPAFFAVPACVLKTVFGEGASVVLEGQRVSGYKLIQSGFEYKYKTIASALTTVL